MEVQLDGNCYRIEQGLKPFDDGEYVRYNRQTHTVVVSEDLAPHKRMSLVAGLLLAENRRIAYQRAATGLMSLRVDESLRDVLGTSRRQGVQGYKLITTPIDLDAHFGVSPEYAAARIVELGNEGLIISRCGGETVPALATWGIEDSSTAAGTGSDEAFLR